MLGGIQNDLRLLEVTQNIFPMKGPKLPYEQLLNFSLEIKEYIIKELFFYDLMSAWFKNLTLVIHFSRFPS